MPMYDKLVAFLKGKSIAYREVAHAAEGACDKVSAIRGNKLSQAMKAMMYLTKKTKKDSSVYWLAIVRGDQNVDMEAIKKVAGAAVVMPAPKDKAEKLADCKVGSIPPFSFDKDLNLVVDPSIGINDEIVFNAGKHDVSFFMSSKDYLAHCGAKLHAIAKDIPVAADDAKAANGAAAPKADAKSSTPVFSLGASTAPAGSPASAPAAAPAGQSADAPAPAALRVG